jgi:uncharacterized protein YdaU (DUF1376 family)
MACAIAGFDSFLAHPPAFNLKRKTLRKPTLKAQTKKETEVQSFGRFHSLVIFRQKGTETMAERLPWFKLFAADYLLDSDVDSMPREAEALLLRTWCICHIEGSCPADPEELARKTRCNLKYVLKYKQYYEPFFELRNERLYSHRMEQEKRRSEQARANVSKRYKQTTSEIGSENGSSNGTTACTTQSQSQSQKQSQDQEHSADATTHTRFTRPSLEDVADYCKERGGKVDSGQFHDYYSSNGWKVGRNPMRDWKSAVRTWERNESSFKGKNGNGTANKAEQRLADNLAACAEAKRSFGMVG